ncbi:MULTISPECIES: enolase [Acidiplasma]|jgi:enolase|uniref:Enolase n=2 Tax=Acidiplasma TaxID=507753 RepID=A0A0N8VLK5_9ARCH|nr:MULTISPECIES: enolase [Acidiplasma]KJE49658.1 enolase [Acidiplasma sp. MBA-1]KPV46289.1 enolase [Acidiplasma aeolicum]KQB36682.1 enolase [Acidiplasma aeolicum]KQB36780.1 enolase [Acidiplasma cupricumulans]WMT55781.1 MAG: enolase [Acidiplasma sp.]
MNEVLQITGSSVRKIFDSRGNIAIEATINIGNYSGTCSAPAGASTGETEVIAYPDRDVEKSIDFYNRNIRNAIIGFNALAQRSFDTLLHDLDGTDNFSAMGGNLATALSIANAKAVASYLNIPLYRYVGGLNPAIPRPLGNIIGGGKHSKRGTTIQEFLVSSQGKSFYDSVYYNILVHKKVGEILSDKLKNQSVGLGDEKAWTADVSDEEAIDIMKSAVNEISSDNKVKILLGVDFAADSFYNNGKYIYKNKILSRDEQIDFAISLNKEHGFYYIEDPLFDTDFEGFSEITSKIGNNALIVGDDLYTTNPERIKKGIELKSTNGVLIKVNQIGTLSDTTESVKLATKNKMETVVSHRSGETTDDFIAHLAVGFNSKLIKSGTIGGERLAKLNELIRIEEGLID